MIRLFSLLSIVFFLAGCQFFQIVRTGEFPNERLEKKCLALEVELEKEKKESAAAQSQLRSEYAAVKAGLSDLRNEVQTLRGELEQNAFLMERHIKEYKVWRQTQDNALLARQTQENVSVVPKQPVSGSPAVAESSGPASPGADTEQTFEPSRAPAHEVVLDEEALYEEGRQLFDAADYAGARLKLEEFLKLYPKSKECDNAHFWIGETYYREDRYEKAILEYQNVIDNYPGANKMPAALLKQGMAFNKIKDDINARLVFKRLVRDFPDSQEAQDAGKLLKEL